MSLFAPSKPRRRESKQHLCRPSHQRINDRYSTFPVPILHKDSSPIVPATCNAQRHIHFLSNRTNRPTLLLRPTSVHTHVLLDAPTNPPLSDQRYLPILPHSKHLRPRPTPILASTFSRAVRDHAPGTQSIARNECDIDQHNRLESEFRLRVPASRSRIGVASSQGKEQLPKVEMTNLPVNNTSISNPSQKPFTGPNIA